MNVAIYKCYFSNHLMDLDEIWYRSLTLALSLWEHLFFTSLFRFDPSGVSLMLSSFSPIVFYRTVLPILKLLMIFMEKKYISL